MDAPLIGIVTYGRSPRGYGAEERFTLPAQYVDALRRAGGIPILLPPGDPRVEDWLETVDGLLLAGGGDVDPALFDAEPHALIEEVDPLRDHDEVVLVHQAIEIGLPLLAVCRGMQILNVALGGDLFQHLPDALPEAMPHRRTVAPEGGGAMQAVPVPHDVDVDPGSQLAAVLEVARASVMSLHHQAVDEPGDGLAVVARAPDGVIEGMEMPEHPWLLAIQWHPELHAAGDLVQQRLFAGLVQAAAGAR